MTVSSIRNSLARRARVTAIALQKGGTAKTTTTVNLAHAMAVLGKRVLVLDLDPQASASRWLGIENTERGAYFCLRPGRTVSSEIVSVIDGAVDLLPSSHELSRAELDLVSVLGREKVLRKAIEPVLDAYDFILIDTPPNLGLLTVNALTASDDLLIPVEAKAMALDGINFLMQVVEAVRADTNPELVINGFVATRVDRRNKLSTNMVLNLREAFGNQVYRTEVRENVRLGEAPLYCKPIALYDPKCSGTEDYGALAMEFMARGKIREVGYEGLATAG